MNTHDKLHPFLSIGVAAVTLACGCLEAPEVVEVPDEEPAWIPPYSPCEDNAFSCGELTADVVERSERLDAIVDDMLGSGEDVSDIASRIQPTEGQNASATGDALMWWVDGGIPRIRWTRSFPDITATDETITSDELAALFTFDETSSRRGGLATRMNGLAAHGARKGFARNTKKVLILSPYYHYGVFWKRETDEVERLFKADPQYRDTVLVAQGTNVTPDVFRGFREFDVIHVVSHGAQQLEVAVGSKRISALLTSQVLRLGTRDPERTYTADELSKEVIGDCGIFDRTMAGLAAQPGVDMSVFKGVACALVPMNHEGFSQKIDTPVVAVTSEYLANPKFNSAPLEDTFVNFSACSTGEDLSLSGFDLFMGDGGSLFAYTGVVSESYATDTAISFYEDMLRYSYDTKYIFDLNGYEDTPDPTNAGTHPILYSPNGSSIRLEETVFLNPEGNADLEGIGDPTVAVLPRTVDGDRFDRVDLDVELRGVHLQEGDLPSDFSVGIFFANERGEPVGDVLEPGWLRLGQAEGSMKTDELTGAWSLRFEGVVVPVDLADEPNIQIAVQARLIEGGVSQTSYNLNARDPTCPTATLAVDGGPKELLANEVTVTGFGPVWTINVGRAEFDADGEQTERVYPSAAIIVSGVDMGNLGTGWTTITMDEDSGNSGTVTYGDTAYYLAGEISLADGSTFESDTTLSVRRLPGTNRVVGKVEGLVSAANATDVRPNIDLTLDFISAEVGDGEPNTRCYFYVD